MKRDLYAEVSARIVAELEAGAAPWVRPWSATAGQNVPQNALTNRPYSGCNVILLWLGVQLWLVNATVSHFQASARSGRQRAQGRTRNEGLFRQATARPRG